MIYLLSISTYDMKKNNVNNIKLFLIFDHSFAGNVLLCNSENMAGGNLNNRFSVLNNKITIYFCWSQCEYINIQFGRGSLLKFLSNRKYVSNGLGQCFKFTFT